MKTKTQEQQVEHLDDEFEPIELGSVYEETKGGFGSGTEHNPPQTMSSRVG